jgi:cysteinyl-tRNA synthetase
MSLALTLSDGFVNRDIVKTPLDARAFRYMVVTSQVHICTLLCLLSTDLISSHRESQESPISTLQAPISYVFTRQCVNCQYRSTLSFTEDTFLAAKHALHRVDRAVAALRSIVSSSSSNAEEGRVAITTAGVSGDGREVGTSTVASPDHSIASLCERSMEQFEAAMCDDLNGPRASAALFQLIGAAESMGSQSTVHVNDAQIVLESIQRMDEVLGVLYEVPLSYVKSTEGVALEGTPPPSQEAKREAEGLAAERVRLKALRQYEDADTLRERIKQLGFGVRDVAVGFELFELHTA